MGDIYARSIESVQAALSLFNEKSDQRKSWSTSSNELDKEKELDGLIKDLANYKVQLEAKDSAYKKALLKLDHYQKISDEFFTLLKNFEFENDINVNECREARLQIGELESKMDGMVDQLSEIVDTREQLSNVTNELKATRGELLSMETELAAARESKLEAMAKADSMETELQREKLKTEELLMNVSELNETILHLKLAATEAEEKKRAVLSGKDAELQLAATTALEAQEQLENMREQLEVVMNLKNQLTDKSVFIDSLRLELQQANELHKLSDKAASNAIKDLNQLKSDFQLQERKNSDQEYYIKLLETELNQTKLEFKNAKEELSRLKNEMEETKGGDTEAQVEIAMLKSELVKGRSKIAVAEAAEKVRANTGKSGLYLPVHQLALEAEEAKKVNQRLEAAAGEEAEETENTVLVNPQYEKSSPVVEHPQMDVAKTQDDEKRDAIDTHITISMEEYELLVKAAEKADQVLEPVAENRNELESLMRELEIKMMKISEFRTRAEQAVSRAEVAEKAKSEVEDRLRRGRERMARRKAALAALREESIPKESSSFEFDKDSETFQPLSKVLNIN
ncbi:protein WEAK CHLOROPLAST MOVEMENT UNDER BLUE LIGHT 1-like [Cornus florida]|uniref:protein WEAK CHLOROPLAST MOVEMENT UNDER BLUE LIGHT 1-like n=1 Tax=Cornus florida TaxID=4283 RepID=UPI002898E91F|nr:protein WEAK CHLOROPLAST MOVEMENT UNDER BLUE LIGHT 1-like [Cornus florida]